MQMIHEIWFLTHNNAGYSLHLSNVFRMVHTLISSERHIQKRYGNAKLHNWCVMCTLHSLNHKLEVIHIECIEHENTSLSSPITARPFANKLIHHSCLSTLHRPNFISIHIARTHVPRSRRFFTIQKNRSKIGFAMFCVCVWFGPSSSSSLSSRWLPIFLQQTTNLQFMTIFWHSHFFSLHTNFIETDRSVNGLRLAELAKKCGGRRTYQMKFEFWANWSHTDWRANANCSNQRNEIRKQFELKSDSFRLVTANAFKNFRRAIFFLSISCACFAWVNEKSCCFQIDFQRTDNNECHCVCSNLRMKWRLSWDFFFVVFMLRSGNVSPYILHSQVKQSRRWQLEKNTRQTTTTTTTTQ